MGGGPAVATERPASPRAGSFRAVRSAEPPGESPRPRRRFEPRRFSSPMPIVEVNLMRRSLRILALASPVLGLLGWGLIHATAVATADPPASSGDKVPRG